jgi:methyl-accepting chemotaxis protein
MKISSSMTSKIMVAFIAIFVVTITALTAVTTFIMKGDLSKRLTVVVIPTTSATIFAEIDRQLLQAAAALELPASDPFLKEWIKKGEPAADLPKVVAILKTITGKYKTLGSNTVLNKSRTYYDFSGDALKTRTLTEKDSWFDGFGKSGKPFNINVYTDHPDFKEVAFINRRIDDNGEYLGIISVSLKLADLVNRVVTQKIGAQGETYLIDGNGVIRIHANKELVNKENVSGGPIFAKAWSKIKESKEYLFEAKRGSDNRYIYTRHIPELDWYLVVEASQGELFADLKRSTYTSVGTAIVLLLAATFLVTLVVRGSSRRIRKAVVAAESLADGDLTTVIEVDGTDESGQLLAAMQKMLANLQQVVGQTVEAANQVSIAADHISDANMSFSQKITEQAASVEETTAAMEEIGASTRSSAENAREANSLARSSKTVAEAGTAVMADTIAAMNEINKSSAKIANISNVIEEIAFQTNLLALNAAVEAARAGEHGKGFAVVAAEIRSLAGRTTQSAKEINTLIEDSGEKTGRGVQLAQELDKKLNEVVAGIKKVTDLMDEVAAASQEQSSGINQVNTAMSQVDQATQQNATLVEGTSASAEELAAQARALLDVVSFFTVDDGRSRQKSRKIMAEPATERALPLKMRRMD